MVKSRVITWLILVWIDFDGWSENSVVGIECLSENKIFFYAVSFG